MKKILCLVPAVFLCGAAFAQHERIDPVRIMDSHMYALGGSHTAYTDTVYGLFVNPAAIARTNRGSAFELSVSAGEALDVIQRLTNGSMDTGNSTGFINLFKDKNGVLKFGPGAIVQGPLAVGYAANGFGFGIWDQVEVKTTVQNSTITVGVNADVITAFGAAATFLDIAGHSVDVGVTFKPFLRATITGVASMDAVDFLQDINNISARFDELMQNAHIPVIAGFGVDAGIMYRWRQFVALGVSFTDIYTRGLQVTDLKPLFVQSQTGSVPVNDIVYRAPFKMNAGIAGTVKLGDFLPALPLWLGESYLALMADWKDILNQHWGSGVADVGYRHPLLNLGFGAELGLFNFLKIRAGLFGMLPAAGIGLHFGAFQIAASIYGVELGNEPGQFSTYAVNLSISVRPRSEAKKWPWSGPVIARR